MSKEGITFDFVLDLTLRSSLSSDYREMEVCYASGAWKACQVMAGSIAEALLLDYLLAEKVIKTYDEATTKSLESLILDAYKAKLISERVKEQAMLTKRYRNLIHQGRGLRNKEICDENSAMTSVALIRMIIGEISSTRKLSYGYTADQLCQKLIDDPENYVAFDHLIQRMKQQELERLLSDSLPALAFKVEPAENPDFDPFADDPGPAYRGNHKIFDSVLKTYEMVYAQSNSDIRESVSTVFAEQVRAGTNLTVARWIKWFFRAYMLSYCHQRDRELLINYLIQTLNNEASIESLKQMYGIIEYISESQIPSLIDKTALRADQNRFPSDFRSECWKFISMECCFVPKHLVKPMQSRLKYLAQACDDRGFKNHAQRIRELNVSELIDPFADD